MFQVNISSLSEAAGLQPGDLLLAVNGQDVQNYRHKEAQDTIVRAGNNFEITVQRSVDIVQQNLYDRKKRLSLMSQKWVPFMTFFKKSYWG